MQKKQWFVRPSPPENFFTNHPELPKVVATLLYHRGITDTPAINAFLHPDFSAHVHNPFLFQDMEKAVARIFEAIEKNEHITVHGDYDADGVCASTILTTTLHAIGAKTVSIFIPHREIDGYGLNINTVNSLKERGTTLLITCDCGVSNVKEIEHGNAIGIDTIVTDHHAVPSTLPKAAAIIHPGVPGEPYPDKGLCGAGVAYKLACALLETHKKNGGLLPENQSHDAFSKWLLDCVAIASVADMVPLLGETRVLTTYGLLVLNKTKRIGLQKMLLEARLSDMETGKPKKDLNTGTIGFQIAPRINAAGRMDHANVAYALFTTKDPIEAINLAFQLEQNNKDRQACVEDILKVAIAQAEEQTTSPILFVCGKGWLTGVVGLVASRLKERYNKPTFAMADHEGEIVGSGRSVDGFNMVEAIQQIPQVFAKFGGHPMACGFTLREGGNVAEFREAILPLFEAQTRGKDMSAKFAIDAELSLSEVTWSLYDTLSRFEPFGKDNERPKYLSRGLTVQSVKSMGKSANHITLMLSDHTKKICKTVGWNMCSEKSETNWCTTLQKGDKVDIVYEVDINEWNGNRDLQLLIIDLRKSDML